MKKDNRGFGLIGVIIVGVLAVIGVLLLIVMIMPDDEDDSDTTYDIEAQQNNDTVNTDLPHYASGLQTNNVETISIGSDARSATVMVYINGSDLESEGGEATKDIAEMIASGVGKNVNVIVQTMGTKEWQEYDIASNTSQTYRIANNNLELIRDGLGQLDCTSKDTMSEFIGFCKDNYPADRYIFLFWDHGGGPVYGFGYDEWQKEDSSLTIAEMAEAFKEHQDIHFDIIGMDCCIMASMETCYALAPYCKYALLSEDFESGMGWSYTGWMRALEENPGISAPLLGKYIIDDIIEENENSIYGSSSCIGLFNVSTAESLYSAWKTYAYKNEEALLDTNFSRLHMSKARGKGFWDFWGLDGSNVTLSDYYISDMLALIESIDRDSEEAKNLMSVLKAAVAYYGHTSDKNELTGLAVSIPYGDSDFYDDMADVYSRIGFDDEYINWLGHFVYDDYDDYYDFGIFEGLWNGWGAYEDEYGCNISGGGSCEYGYDYEDEGEEYSDDWIYDYEEDIWYLYEDDTLYLYDEETDLLFYYDEDTDEIYYYDDDIEDWVLYEE